MQEKDITQFINQESFLNYCFNREAKDVLYWEEWLIQHPEQQQAVEKLKATLILLGDQSRTKTINLNFAELHGKIKGNKGKSGAKTYPLWMKWTGAASAAVVLICAGLFFFSKPTNLLSDQDITPGGNRAVLILSDGKKIDLNGISNGTVVKQAGIKITKTLDGQLVYDVDVAGKDMGDDAYNTIQTPIGGQYQVNLSDGTKVWLNSGSSLRYPLKFAGNDRHVDLKGEGYFEVKHNKDMPFKVTSGKQLVQVLGTHFNIMAYADEKVVKTTLLEGAVSVRYGNEVRLLKPNQQSQLNGQQLSIVDDIDIEDAVAWKNGYFKFNESLESIMNKLSRWYGVEVVYESKPDPNLTYTGKISRARNISAVLKIIEFNGDVSFKIEGKKVYVTD